MGNPITSETQIANLSLAIIGQKPITDITDTTNKNSRECLRWYGLARDGVLRRAYWNWAQKRATLSQDATAPEYEWSYRYALPEDYIKLRKFNSYPETYPEDAYQVEDGYILTDDETAEIRYTYRVEDVTKFDSLFIDAFSIHLAAKLARIISGSTQTPDNLDVKYERVLSMAMNEDANENRVNHRGVEGLLKNSVLRNRRFSSPIG